MLIDCSTCVVRGRECATCVVSVLFGGEPAVDIPWHAPGRSVELGSPAGVSRPSDDVDRAIEVLAAAGMLGPDRVSIGLIPTVPLAKGDRRHAG